MKAKFLEIDCDEIPVPFAVLQGYWVIQNLHFVMIFLRAVQIAIMANAADKMRFLLSDSQCLRAFNQGFLLFFFGCFYLEFAEICWYIKKCPFLVFFGATDGNLKEKYNVTPLWKRTCLWQMTGSRIVSCRSADFDMF